MKKLEILDIGLGIAMAMAMLPSELISAVVAFIIIAAIVTGSYFLYSCLKISTSAIAIYGGFTGAALAISGMYGLAAIHGSGFVSNLFLVALITGAVLAASALHLASQRWRETKFYF